MKRIPTNVLVQRFSPLMMLIIAAKMQIYDAAKMQIYDAAEYIQYDLF